MEQKEFESAIVAEAFALGYDIVHCRVKEENIEVELKKQDQNISVAVLRPECGWRSPESVARSIISEAKIAFDARRER